MDFSDRSRPLIVAGQNVVIDHSSDGGYRINAVPHAGEPYRGYFKVEPLENRSPYRNSYPHFAAIDGSRPYEERLEHPAGAVNITVVEATSASPPDGVDEHLPLINCRTRSVTVFAPPGVEVMSRSTERLFFSLIVMSLRGKDKPENSIKLLNGSWWHFDFSYATFNERELCFTGGIAVPLALIVKQDGLFQVQRFQNGPVMVTLSGLYQGFRVMDHFGE